MLNFLRSWGVFAALNLVATATLAAILIRTVAICALTYR
jgi:hypothetical protein